MNRDTLSDLIDKLDPRSKAPGWVAFSYEVGPLAHRAMDDIFNYGRAQGLAISTWERGWIFKTVSVRIEGQMDNVYKLLLRVNRLLYAEGEG